MYFEQINKFIYWAFALIILLGLNSCEEDSTPVEDKEVYEGPVRIGRQIDMLYTESEQKKSIIKAPLLEEFKNGDRKFPEGINIIFYDDKGEISNTLVANYAFFDKKENRWLATGDVEIVSVKTEEQLNTEKLYWEPESGEIYNDVFVTIKSQNSVSYGTGLKTNQEFTEWSFDKFEGEMTMQ